MDEPATTVTNSAPGCAHALTCPAHPYIAVIAMPSFDIVSEVDTHELTNAVDQANRELSTRFAFKGVEASFERDENLLTTPAPHDFQGSEERRAGKECVR